jgi:hypothetical protein
MKGGGVEADKALGVGAVAGCISAIHAPEMPAPDADAYFHATRPASALRPAQSGGAIASTMVLRLRMCLVLRPEIGLKALRPISTLALRHRGLSLAPRLPCLVG